MSVCVLGSINWDIVAHVEELPRPGETILSQRLGGAPGGKGLNQAVAAARFGAATQLIGALGDDALAPQLRAFLKAEAIDDRLVRDIAGVPSGQAFICLDAKGDNLIVVTPGANAQVGARDVPAVDARVLLAQFEMPFAAIEAFFTTGTGLKILNAAPALKEGRYLLPLANILIVNETELAHLSGRSVAGGGDVIPAARALLSANQTVIVTLGAQGAMAVDAAAATHVPGRTAKVVDTVGAGDCFCGVLAAALAEGAAMADALRLANLAAALSVERPGAADAMPHRDELRAAAGGGLDYR